MNDTDVYRDAGVLILGSRLRRLSERILADINRIYREGEIPFEPAWFPLFFILEREKSITVSLMAQRLRVTQPAVSQTAVNLESRGLVTLEPDPDDRRRRTIRLTAAGEALLKEIRPVWDSLEERLQEILGEGAYSRNLMAGLTELETALDTGNLAGDVVAEIRNKTDFDMK